MCTILVFVVIKETGLFHGPDAGLTYALWTVISKALGQNHVIIATIPTKQFACLVLLFEYKCGALLFCLKWREMILYHMLCNDAKKKKKHIV